MKTSRLLTLGLLLAIALVTTQCAPATSMPPAPTSVAPSPTSVSAAPAPTQAPTSAPPTPAILTKVSLRLPWQPQTQFAGFYVALWNGYYKDEGLDLTINPSGPSLNALQEVASGTDTFGLMEPHFVIVARDQGIPVVAVYQTDQTTYLRYIAKVSSGIKTPKDFKGKRIGVWFGGGDYDMIAMLKQAGLDPTKDVTLIEESAGMGPFYSGQLDVAEVTTFNELQQVYQQGYKPSDLVIFNAMDYGIGLVGHSVVTREEVIAQEPDVVQGMVNATARGWVWAYEHPDETCQMFVQHFPDLDLNFQKTMLVEETKIYTAGGAHKYGVGYMDPAYYTTAFEVLMANQVLKGIPDVTKAYTTQFWDKIPADYKTLPPG
jgi:NitT/TauT family transport system substrate-binding protein